jgi:O-antigen/teichoic acid export membrane protein
MLTVALRFRKYFENAFWLIFEKSFSLLVGMMVGIYVARYLQPEAFGLLNYGIGFVSIFSAFATLGMDQILVRELAKGRSGKNDLLGTGFILKLSGSLLLMVVMLIILLLLDHGPFTNMLIMIIAAAEIFRGFEVINYFFQSKVQSKYVVQVQLFINLMISISKIGLVFLHAPLIWFAIIIVIGSILNAAGFIFAYQAKEDTPWNWRFRKPLALELLKESWPLAFYGLALHTQARIDQVMLGNMMNNYEVGQYSVALKVIEIFGFVPMILMSTFTPAVTKGKATSESLYQSRLVNLYRLMFLTFLLMAVPIYLLGEDIITLLYGIEYQAAGYLLSLFALRLFFANMGVGKSVFIVNESLFKYSLLTVILGALTNIILNYFLIPLHGAPGAIAGSMISFAVSIFLVDMFFEKTRENQKLMFQGILSFWKLKNVV